MNDARCRLTPDELEAIHDRVLSALVWASGMMDLARGHSETTRYVSLGGVPAVVWREVEEGLVYATLREEVERAKWCFARSEAKIGKVEGINYHQAAAILVARVSGCAEKSRTPIEREWEPDDWTDRDSWMNHWPATRRALLAFDFDYLAARAALEREYLNAVERLAEAEAPDASGYNEAEAAKQARELLVWLDERLANGCLPTTYVRGFQERVTKLFDVAHAAPWGSTVAEGWAGVCEALGLDIGAHLMLSANPDVGRVLFPCPNLSFDSSRVERLRVAMGLMGRGDLADTIPEQRRWKQSPAVVAGTAGGLWKALSEGTTPAYQCSAIGVTPPVVAGPGAYKPTVRCPEQADESKRIALERALALVRAEGGEKAAAMEKLIGQVQLKTRKDWATVVNMPLADFVAVLMPSEAEQSEPANPATKRKRSTEPGEARAKLVAALTVWHKFADGACLNQSPVGNNELARLAGVSNHAAHKFFKREFEGHVKYRKLCGDVARLIVALRTLNGELRPREFFGGRESDE